MWPHIGPSRRNSATNRPIGCVPCFSTPKITWDSLVQELGSNGRLNFFWEPMAAGKGGAENMAATTLIRVIHECICSGFLEEKAKPQMGSKQHYRCHRQNDLSCSQDLDPLGLALAAMAPGALPTVTRVMGVGTRGAVQSTVLTLGCFPSRKA